MVAVRFLNTHPCRIATCVRRSDAGEPGGDLTGFRRMPLRFVDVQLARMYRHDSATALGRLFHDQPGTCKKAHEVMVPQHEVPVMASLACAQVLYMTFQRRPQKWC